MTRTNPPAAGRGEPARRAGVTPLVPVWGHAGAGPHPARDAAARVAADPALAAEVAALSDATRVLREDRPAPRADLADRVLRSGAEGGGETLRFERLARRYAVAAVALLAVGVGGSAYVRSAAATEGPRTSAKRPEKVISDVVEVRFTREVRFVIDSFQSQSRPKAPSDASPGNPARGNAPGGEGR